MSPGMMIVTNNPKVRGWNLDSMYTSKKNVYPWPIPIYSNTPNSLIGFKINKDESRECKAIDEGIKVFLTVPGDALKLSRNYIQVSFSKRNSFRLKITVSNIFIQIINLL